MEGNLPTGARTLATYAQGVREADESLKMLMDWASKRNRETIAFWGDHLPPLGTVYPDTGYMRQVATRKASLDVMKREHETPLVIWSSRRGVRKDIGTISPALLPYNLLKTAGFEHPFFGLPWPRAEEIQHRRPLPARNARQPDISRLGPRRQATRSADTRTIATCNTT